MNITFQTWLIRASPSAHCFIWFKNSTFWTAVMETHQVPLAAVPGNGYKRSQQLVTAAGNMLQQKPVRLVTCLSPNRVHLLFYRHLFSKALCPVKPILVIFLNHQLHQCRLSVIQFTKQILTILVPLAQGLSVEGRPVWLFVTGLWTK